MAAQLHPGPPPVQAGGTLLGTEPGSVAAQGEDLAGWARTQQLGWDRLGPAQQWICEHVLGLLPLAPEKQPKAGVSHTEKEARNLAAAAQYRQREGHLNAPRSRKATIPTERAARLTELGMRWE